MNKKRILIIGVCIIGITILLDAFGAHGLKKIVSKQSINTYGIGTKYLGLTGFSFCLLGLIARHYPISPKWIIRMWTTGVILFSGSLFILCFKNYFPGAVLSIVGPLTPLGGVFIIIGWGLLAYKLIKWKT